MNMKKIIILILLACLVALSISSVQASNENLTLQSADDILNSQIMVDGSADEIARQIEKAEDGDIVDLGENKEYDINKDSICIAKKITLKGSNVTITSGSSEGVLRLQGNDITIQGITFKNPVELSDDEGKLCGKAIYAIQESNLLIDGCQFINYECGIDIHDSNNTTIKNCWFNATGTSVSEKSQTGISESEKLETGTSENEIIVTGFKAIQLTDSTDAQIINNSFYSKAWNGLSIILGSGNDFFENCSFTNTTFYSDNENQTFPVYEEIPSLLKVFPENQTNLNTTGKISKEIKLLAKLIVGKTKGIEAVKKLAVWVSKNIASETAEGFYQSPLTTFKRKLGNCCCHSELFLQLCASLGYTNEFDMYIVHVGSMKFGRRHFFTVIGNFCVDTSKKNPWGKGGFGNKPVYSITKYPYLSLIRQY